MQAAGSERCFCQLYLFSVGFLAKFISEMHLCFATVQGRVIFPMGFPWIFQCVVICSLTYVPKAYHSPMDLPLIISNGFSFAGGKASEV